MAWEIKYYKNVVYIINTSSMTYKQYEESTIKALELGKKHNTNLFLSDHSKAKNKATIFEIFYLPALYDKLGASRKNKLAIILPKHTYKHEDYTFYETICINRGWNVKLLRYKKNAIKWLSD